MPRIPKGMTKEEYRDQRLLEGHYLHEQITMSLDPVVLHKTREFCKEKRIKISFLVSALLKENLLAEGLESNPVFLSEEALRLSDEIDHRKQQCGPSYQKIKEAYVALGGEPDGSNCNDILPMLYNHLSKDKELKKKIPYFERIIRLRVHRRQIVTALEVLGVETGVQK